VQCIGLPGIGIRLPVMMGVTFASVGPMLSMAAAPRSACSHLRLGHRGRHLWYPGRPFRQPAAAAVPPVVTGTIIMVIGISLMRVASTGPAAACRP